MTGIENLTDDSGQKIAVQIDLRQHAGLWQDFEDLLVSEARRDEEAVPLHEVRAKLIANGKLSA